MARRRIWRKKPPEVRERLRAERAKKNNGGNGRRMLAVPPVETGPDAADLFRELSARDRAVAWRLMANHGLSVAGAVDAVREVMA